ncbi:Leucine-rich_repeat domain superfamily [Hexamita inflata]|uniref:Leucine-rich repeat domain superfamily n=1 Tax=Hexamita inflata TaxID=28002 RepID=A0AA86TN63_9EUKA|nr:Leucine-rich repeat domain superfamily [Hexamita inflata]
MHYLEYIIKEKQFNGIIVPEIDEHLGSEGCFKFLDYANILTLFNLQNVDFTRAPLKLTSFIFQQLIHHNRHVILYISLYQSSNFSGLTSLINLKSLSIIQCGLTEMPLSIQNLYKLEYLDLCDNCISCLNNIKLLVNLIYLNLSNNNSGRNNMMVGRKLNCAFFRMIRFIFFVVLWKYFSHLQGTSEQWQYSINSNPLIKASSLPGFLAGRADISWQEEDSRRFGILNLANCQKAMNKFIRPGQLPDTVVSEPTLILTNVYVIIALENQITVFMLIITYSINSAVHFFFTSSFK